MKNQFTFILNPTWNYKFWEIHFCASIDYSIAGIQEIHGELSQWEVGQLMGGN